MVIKLDDKRSVLLETKVLENEDKNHEQDDKDIIIEQEKENHYFSIELNLLVQNVEPREAHRRGFSQNWNCSEEDYSNHAWQRRLLVRGHRPSFQNLQREKHNSKTAEGTGGK